MVFVVKLKEGLLEKVRKIDIVHRKQVNLA